MDSPPALRVLMLEDTAADAEINVRALGAAGLAVEAHRVENRAGFEAALRDFAPDIALLDYNVPGFDGRAALNLLRQTRPDLPVIVVSGTLGDEAAAEMIKAGASDYVLKDRLARLAPAVKAALEEARLRREGRLAEEAARAADRRFRGLFEHMLEGFARCRMIYKDGAPVDFVFEEVNEAFYSFSGLQGAIGRRVSELLPDFIAANGPLFEACADVARTGVARRLKGHVSAFKKWFQVSVYGVEPGQFAATFDDVTDSHESGRKLAERERYFHAMIDDISDGILIVALDGRIDFVNAALERAGGYQASELQGRNIAEFIHPGDLPALARRMKELAAKPLVPLATTYRLRVKTGEWRDWDVVSRNMITDPAIQGIVTTLRDVTERNRLQREVEDSQQALRESEELLRCVTNSAHDAIVMIGNDGAVSFWNPAAERVFGYPAADVLGQELHQLLAPERYLAAYREAFPRFRESGQGAAVGKTLELEARRKDGTEFTVEMSLSAARLKEQWNGVATVRDITERKRAQQALQESEVRFRSLIEDASVTVSVVGRDGAIRYVSPAFAALGEQSGFTPDELVGRNIFDFVHPDDAAAAARHVAEVLATRDALPLRLRLRHKDGTWRHIEILSRNLLDTAPIHGIVIDLHDVTQLVAAEQALEQNLAALQEQQAATQRLNRALRTLSACNSTLVHATSEEELYAALCRIAVELGGYSMAWVGRAEPDASKTVRPVASAGDDSGYLAAVQVSWADNELGRGGTGTCIRTGKTQIMRLSDPTFAPWRAEAQKRGYGASISLPLTNAGGTYGALVMYSTDPAAFDDTEVSLLTELVTDLAFGVGVLRARRDNENNLVRLSRSMEATVQALAGTVEMRDPYTAGHQRRVGALSRAIGVRMALPEERIRGLALAASIHDVGKINVPAEILSKPGRLSPIEFELIKAHPDTGYEIVKNVDFPWPIAEMIRQHHERLDGSGYPRGLKAADILLEAQIIAVADVVEAMSSHRPYRAGLGLQVALDEISRQRGLKLNAKAVDACLGVWKDGFDWDG